MNNHPLHQHISKIFANPSDDNAKSRNFFGDFNTIDNELSNSKYYHTTPLLVILEAIKTRYYDNVPMSLYKKVDTEFLMNAFCLREVEARAILTILKCDFDTPKQRQREAVVWKKKYSTKLLDQLYYIKLFDFSLKRIETQPTAKDLKKKYSNKNNPHREILDGCLFENYISNRNIDAIWQILAHPSKKRNKK